MGVCSQVRDFKTAKHRKQELAVLDRHLRKLRQLVPKMEAHAAAQRFELAEAVQKNIERSRRQLDKELERHHRNRPDMLVPFLDDPRLHPPHTQAPGALRPAGPLKNKKPGEGGDAQGWDRKGNHKKARRRRGNSSSESGLRSGSGSSSSSDSSTGSSSDSDSGSDSGSSTGSSASSGSGVSSVSSSSSGGGGSGGGGSNRRSRRSRRSRAGAGAGAGPFAKGASVVYCSAPGASRKSAVVKVVHHDGTYDIKLSSGKGRGKGKARTKERVEARTLSAASSQGRDGREGEARPVTARDLAIGDAVEARVRLKGSKLKQWVAAKVVDVSAAEKMVAVKYVFDAKANVCKTAELVEGAVRWPGTGGAEAAEPHWVVGARVQARYRGEDAWLPGELVRLREDGTCDVLFDAGAGTGSRSPEKEKRMRLKHIRLVPPPPAGAPDAALALMGAGAGVGVGVGAEADVAHKARLIQEGAKVQYNDLGEWVNAVVTRVYRNRRRGTTLYAVRVERDRTIRSDLSIDELRVRSVFDHVEAFYLGAGGGARADGGGGGDAPAPRGVFSVSRDSGRLVRLASKLSRKLRAAQEQGVVDDLTQLFQAADRDADGYLSTDELQDFLRVLRVRRLPHKDCEDLITLFGAGGDGDAGAAGLQRAALVAGGPVLSWGGFLRLTGVYDARDPAVRRQQVARVTGKLRRFFQELLDRRDSDGLFRTFEDLDPGGEGLLTYSAFHYGLANMGLQLRADEAVLVCDQFDLEDDGTIDYKKFVRFCTADEEGGSALVDYVRDRLLQDCRTRAGRHDTAALFRRIGGLSGVAGRNDGGASGQFLSWHDFYAHCARAYGMQLAAPRRRRLQQELRVTRSGRVSYKAFCEFLGIHLSAEELGLVPMQVDPSAAITGSVGEWVERVASNTERLNYFHLLQVLDEFERTAGLQQSREFDSDKNDLLQSLTIQLGSRLKCSLHFHL